jgi:hypothetical protein
MNGDGENRGLVPGREFWWWRDDDGALARAKAANPAFAKMWEHARRFVPGDKYPPLPFWMYEMDARFHGRYCYGKPLSMLSEVGLSSVWEAVYYGFPPWPDDVDFGSEAASSVPISSSFNRKLRLVWVDLSKRNSEILMALTADLLALREETGIHEPRIGGAAKGTPWFWVEAFDECIEAAGRGECTGASLRKAKERGVKRYKKLRDAEGRGHWDRLLRDPLRLRVVMEHEGRSG